MKSKPFQYLESIYEEHYYELRRYLARMTGSQEEAEDIIQELFTKIITKPSIISDVRSLKGWLKVAARNTLLDRYKKKKPSLLKEGDMIEDLLINNSSPEKQLIVDTQLDSVLATLSKTDKSIILAKEHYGYEYKEISEMLNINISTIKSRVFRVKKRLIKARNDLDE
ncbi:RNA polymerase [Salimicrobium jeotgali]|uniref:RNA polymerase n=1 Tax=Salimicrobium jeotgali TaxID=1230341 RepID=K2H4T7_9BACI|nr:RNA polymerase sigma factor [Salimicrobium jeotgali]AKG05640.1 RNA polymerase [Salimicrobium jeotgali]EKE30885.1 RNA polymerase ECF-type sigma factor [Salimicrobium jeotgali]